MKRAVLRHTPSYFQFYIQDPEYYVCIGSREIEDAVDSRLVVGDGVVSVQVDSEFTEIPITVDLHDSRPEPGDMADWDRVVEAPIDIGSGAIVFAGCPDGPIYGMFGEFRVDPGSYRLRVHYGGLNPDRIVGDSTDHYLVQIWPSQEGGCLVLKPVA